MNQRFLEQSSYDQVVIIPSWYIFCNQKKLVAIQPLLCLTAQRLPRIAY
ncbi:MAG TPA: hypothetical protein VEU97_05485 [Ktedonobacteraceae bacterium]|nr:hypothetical protein [Ktedonobacteraceae bacterium]